MLLHCINYLILLRSQASLQYAYLLMIDESAILFHSDSSIVQKYYNFFERAESPLSFSLCLCPEREQESFRDFMKGLSFSQRAKT